MDALVIMDDVNHKGLHNIIVYVIGVFLEIGPVLAPHNFYQIKPELLLKVIAALRSTDKFTIRFNTTYFGPSQKYSMLIYLAFTMFHCYPA